MKKMRGISALLTAFVLAVCLALCLACGVLAGDAAKSAGDVLYHQDFSEIAAFSSSGIRVGSLSSQSAVIFCETDSLSVENNDKDRVYLILPTVDFGDALTFTLEFSFRFTDTSLDHGYIAPILTCRGCDPSNVTALTLRADGSVDDFKSIDPDFAAAVKAGETVHVSVPVVSGAVNKILFRVGEREYTSERNDLLVISKGSLGFIIRNCDVEIDEIFIVSGTDYAVKTGYYAEKSYADYDTPVQAEECSESNVHYAPPTGDNSGVILIILAVAAVGLVVLGVLGRKKR